MADVLAKRAEVSTLMREAERLQEASHRKSEEAETAYEELQLMLRFVPDSMLAQISPDENGVDLFDSDRSPKIKKTSGLQPAEKGSSGIESVRDQGLRFSAFISEAISKFPKGIGHRELKQAVAESEFSVRLDDQAKAYHRTVSKLIARKEIIRYGEKFYDPEAYKILEKARKLPEIEDGVRLRENSAAGITMQILESSARGLTGPEIKSAVALHPNAPKSVRTHGHYIYNVLSNLIGSGKIEKAGSIYRIANTTTPPRSNGRAS